MMPSQPGSAAQQQHPVDLFAAIRSNDAVALQSCLCLGADLQAVCPTDGLRPLVLAAKMGLPGIVEMLLQCGADPNQTTCDGKGVERDSAPCVCSKFATCTVSVSLCSPEALCLPGSFQMKGIRVVPSHGSQATQCTHSTYAHTHLYANRVDVLH